MNGDVLDNSASLIPSESTEKQQQTFNFTSNNDKNNGLTSVLHGFIVNGLALTAMMKTDLGENGEGDEHNNESLEEISEEIIPKKANQSTSTSKNQNSQNFNNSWHYVQQKEENDISSHFERKKFLNENFGDFEENGDERGKLAKKTYENSDFATEDSQKQQEKDLNLQNFNLEKSKKTNTFSLFSTKMLMTTMTDLGNKKEELDQMSHSSYKNNLMSFPVIEEPKNSKNDTITMPNMPPNIMPKKKKKKPYKELTLEQKVELIRLAERCTNLSQASIAERYAIAKSNVCRILQRKTEYVRALECAGFAGSRKRKLRTAINLVEENDVLINNERKNNLNLFEEEELNNNNSFNIPLYDKKEINKLIDGTWKNEVDETILDGKGEEDDKWF
uniref:HTH psq-type domain-containing protein n=1 Tax=Meloidogyne hapla TaxID=6305 RepID=A0A1I8BNF4_MELHA